MKLSVSEIASAVGGNIIYGDERLIVKNISLNSREMKGDDLFVPVIGEKVDAHRFILQAAENGAVCAFTSISDVPLTAEATAVLSLVNAASSALWL